MKVGAVFMDQAKEVRTFFHFRVCVLEFVCVSTCACVCGNIFVCVCVCEWTKLLGCYKYLHLYSS
jgi:hypothetical protein